MRWRSQAVLAATFAFLAAWCVASLPLPQPLDVDSSLDMERCRRMLDVCERRHQAASDLLAGRKTLAETIACFRAIALEDPFDVLEALRTTFPETSTEEDLLCVQVYHYAQSEASRLRLDESSLQPIRQEVERRRAGKQQDDGRAPPAPSAL